MNTTKYSSEDILQMLIDSYNCQVAFDPEVESGSNLTFDTTIWEWRIICDLIRPKELAKVYHDLFDLQTPLSELEAMMVLEKENKLIIFCDYISTHAKKQIISPIIMMGKNCLTASIFKTLICNLERRGIKTEGIKPSSKFIPLFYKCGGILLDEVNKLAPGSLTKFEYRDNFVVRAGWSIIGIFFLSIIIVPLIWHFYWGLLLIMGLGLLAVIVGKRFKPEKISVGDYDTIRDLILGMQFQLNRLP